jgi:hypothetical protein
MMKKGMAGWVTGIVQIKLSGKVENALPRREQAV